MEPRHLLAGQAQALNDTVGIVLAAGRASRFGSPKQIALFRGRPLIAHPIAALRDAGLEHILVVLGAEADAIAPLSDAQVVRCETWALGQSESLKAGIAAAPVGAARVVVVLGDQPLLSRLAVQRVLDAPGEIVRATYDGVPGHPVVLARAVFEAVGALTGEDGARALVDRFTTVAVPCDGLGSTIDVDTPEDLAALEAAAGLA